MREKIGNRSPDHLSSRRKLPLGAPHIGTAAQQLRGEADRHAVNP
jgi:hypothetical protein